METGYTFAGITVGINGDAEHGFYAVIRSHQNEASHGPDSLDGCRAWAIGRIAEWWPKVPLSEIQHADRWGIDYAHCRVGVGDHGFHNFIRTADMTCDSCGLPYRQHPRCLNALVDDGAGGKYSWLHVLCDGRHVKL